MAATGTFLCEPKSLLLCVFWLQWWQSVEFCVNLAIFFSSTGSDRSEDVRSANIICNENDTQCLVVDREWVTVFCVCGVVVYSWNHTKQLFTSLNQSFGCCKKNQHLTNQLTSLVRKSSAWKCNCIYLLSWINHHHQLILDIKLCLNVGFSYCVFEIILTSWLVCFSVIVKFEYIGFLLKPSFLQTAIWFQPFYNLTIVWC